MANAGEETLINRARDAVSQCNWVVGQCAAEWTERYASGRTDADFGKLVGLSGDQIYQRRRVWERFGDLYETYPSLKWSFFYVAINWDDAADCLGWATENEATVAEMKAWRRARNGEDLTEEVEETYSEWAAPLYQDADAIPLTAVTSPDAAGMPQFDSAAPAGSEVIQGAARDMSDGYAPFRTDAAAAAPAVVEEDPGTTSRPEPTNEQIWGKILGALERMNRNMTPELLKSLPDQPHEMRARLSDAVNDVREKLIESMD